jgi:hypothetical protein
MLLIIFIFIIHRDKDFDFEDIPSTEKKTSPDCKKTFPLGFSMHTFEHFIVRYLLIYCFLIVLTKYFINFILNLGYAR